MNNRPYYIASIVLFLLWLLKIKLLSGLFISASVICLLVALVIEASKPKVQIYDFKRWGSWLNYRNIQRGFHWSTPAEIRRFAKRQKNNPVFIDTFAMYKETVNKLGVWFVPKISISINALLFTRTMLVLGGMGSGKSSFFYQFFKHKHIFRRFFVHDMKGAFVKYFYRKDKDILLNFFDSRHANWSVFAELERNPQTVTAFIRGLVHSAQGEDGKQDFFAASAAEIIKDWIFAAFYNNPGAPDKILWKAFSIERDKYEKTAGDDKTKQSILATARLTFEILELMAKHADKERFTIQDFFDSRDKNLFMLNILEYGTLLTPYFAGFTAALSAIHLSRPDTKEDLTFYLLDEWYTLNLDVQTATTLLTAVRSKGGCLAIGAIFLRKDDKFMQQLMDSSKAMMFIFSVPESETQTHICEAFGDVYYEEMIREDKRNKAPAQFSMRQAPFLTNEQLVSMPAFHHLTFIGEDGIIYLGYTPEESLEEVADPFVPINQDGFYRKKYAKTEESKANILTYQEKETIYQAIKDMGDFEAIHWLENNGYSNINIKELKALFEENEQ
ncbi:MAG: type IV secretion system DNA-binding domain-containing protein [Campylobacterales bacterium]|nr:type IV secretion system DNA-binding domain-containing protein [Campylobacterales bacterium]